MIDEYKKDIQETIYNTYKMFSISCLFIYLFVMFILFLQQRKKHKSYHRGLKVGNNLLTRKKKRQKKNKVRFTYTQMITLQILAVQVFRVGEY